jgi:DNA-binding transcriptional regulator YiaG
MNTSNITNYKPKDFAELIGVFVKTLQRWAERNFESKPHTNGATLLHL